MRAGTSGDMNQPIHPLSLCRSLMQDFACARSIAKAAGSVSTTGRHDETSPPEPVGYARDDCIGLSYRYDLRRRAKQATHEDVPRRPVGQIVACEPSFQHKVAT